jgi:hypothetical protein
MALVWLYPSGMSALAAAALPAFRKSRRSMDSPVQSNRKHTQFCAQQIVNSKERGRKKECTL